MMGHVKPFSKRVSAAVSAREVLFMSVVHLIYWCGNRNSRCGTPLAL